MIVAVDLDGTLAEYDGWKGEAVIGAPKPGALEFIRWLISVGCTPVVYSARASTEDGYIAIMSWLQRHGFSVYITEATHIKHYKFSLFVDDRAVPFHGNWSDVMTAILDRKPHA